MDCHYNSAAEPQAENGCVLKVMLAPVRSSRRKRANGREREQCLFYLDSLCVLECFLLLFFPRAESQGGREACLLVTASASTNADGTKDFNSDANTDHVDDACCLDEACSAGQET
ncbi:unnamed protein product [Caretta caretta]